MSDKSSDKQESAKAEASAPVPSASPSASSEESNLTSSQLIFKLIRDDISILDRAVSLRENRLFLRAIRGIAKIRKSLSRPLLRALAEQHHLSTVLNVYIDESFVKNEKKVKNENSMEEDDDNENEQNELASLRKVFSPVYQRQPSIDILTGNPKNKTTSTLPIPSNDNTTNSNPANNNNAIATSPDVSPEVRAYLHLLVTLFLFDESAYNSSASCINDLITFIHSYNRRTLDWISAKIYSLYSLIFTKLNELPSIRNNLLSAHRTSVLQHNEPGQAALIVALLQNYTSSHLYAPAEAFRLKSTFPETLSSNGLLARYLYYTGLINAVHLNYSDSYTALMAALRKAPQKAAIGFRQTATKLVILVQLLMGEIPDRTIFNTEDLRSSLYPYLVLTRAVRKGDLDAFTQATQKFSQNFHDDNVTSLINRLRHNVIKAGLRKINLAYSSISLSDIANKLHVDSAVDVEAIVVKAIADGVIDAKVDHEKQTLTSSSSLDIYTTTEPQAAFNKRITFCNNIRNEAVKAMRFPPNAHKRGEYEDDEDEEDEEGNGVSRKKKNENKEKEEKEKEKDNKDKKESDKDSKKK